MIGEFFQFLLGQYQFFIPDKIVDHLGMVNNIILAAKLGILIL